MSHSTTSPNPGPNLALSDEHRRNVLAALGMEDAMPTAKKIAELFDRGAVIAIVPPVVRGVRVGEVCPYTGLTHELLMKLRTKGYCTADGEVLVPPFEGWWRTTEGGGGGAHVMIDLPALVTYLHQCKTAAMERRREERERETGTAAA